MSSHTTTHLAWQHHDTGLNLRAAGRRVLVPALIADLLLGDGGHGLTDDPAIDLLRLEQDLRRYARHLASQVSDAAEEVAYARDEITLAEIERGMAGRLHRRAAMNQLTDAMITHTTWVDRHEAARTWINLLRQFVIDTAVPDGLLAEASAGWQHSPDAPPFVTVFATEHAFLDADPRRAAPTWWGTPIPAGVDFGDLWRRDGDDDQPDAAPLPRSGPWRLSYLPRTGEIYATRRSGGLPEEVWLLGTEFHDRDSTVTLLLELEDHMRQPNSLILAAHTIHTEQQRRITEGQANTVGHPPTASLHS